MIDSAVGTAPSSIPSIVAYNIRFLSLSPNQQEQWAKKLANVRFLASQFTVTALLETHVGGQTPICSFAATLMG